MTPIVTIDVNCLSFSTWALLRSEARKAAYLLLRLWILKQSWMDDARTDAEIDDIEEEIASRHAALAGADAKALRRIAGKLINVQRLSVIHLNESEARCLALIVESANKATLGPHDLDGVETLTGSAGQAAATADLLPADPKRRAGELIFLAEFLNRRAAA